MVHASHFNWRGANILDTQTDIAADSRHDLPGNMNFTPDYNVRLSLLP